MHHKFYGFVVWFVATLFVVYSFCLNTAAAVFTNAVKTSLNASSGETALSMGAFTLGFAVMQILAGYLLDKYNPRYVVSFGIFLLALGNILISHAHNLILFAAANFMQGLGASFSFIALGVLISQWFEPKMFPILFGAGQTVSCMLAAFLHYYLTLALKAHTWNAIYQVLGVCGGILVILSITLIRSPANHHIPSALSLKQSLQRVLKNKQILLCAAGAATSFGILLGYAGFWYLPVQEYYSVKNEQSMIISGLIFTGIAIGTPLLGWISNRVHTRIGVLHITIILGAMALLMGIYLPHYRVNTLMIIQIVSFFIGFFLSGSMLFYTIVNEISAAETKGVALSVTNTAVFLLNATIMFVPYVFVTPSSALFFTNLWVLPFLVMVSLLLLYFIKDSAT